MIDETLFYVLAVPAVLIVGISKAGFGGGLGILGVPLLAIAVSPTIAAAIMLPILCLMDLVTVWVYRGRWNRASLWVLLPGAITGIVLGALTFEFMNKSVISMIIGAIAVLFASNWFINKTQSHQKVKPGKLIGSLLGSLAGFTSFVAHAGGPPVNIYLISQRLNKTEYQATTALFFIVVNYIKLIPYTALGLFDMRNLMMSAALLPLVPVGVTLGLWLHNRVNEQMFYKICYVFLFITGIKLFSDGAIGILS